MKRVGFIARLCAALVLAVTALGLLAPPASAVWQDDGYLNVLLIGSDSGFDRKGLRTDTMIVASVDMRDGRTALYGVPRNLVNTPLPEPYAEYFDCGCWESLLNELYQYAEANPEIFTGENPGGDALKDVIGNLLGIEIDFYARVDLAGFVDVVDALGGVDIYVPDPMSIYISSPYEDEEWRQYEIDAGRQTLDGHTALAWVRSREDETDYNRMGRQRCLLGAIAQQADIEQLLLSYPDLVDAMVDSVETDIPVNTVPDIIEIAEMIDFSKVLSIGFDGGDYFAEYVDRYPVPDPVVIQDTVQSVFDMSTDEVESNYGSLPADCDWDQE